MKLRRDKEEIVGVEELIRAEIQRLEILLFDQEELKN